MNQPKNKELPKWYTVSIYIKGTKKGISKFMLKRLPELDFTINTKKNE